jgi:threonine dehydrogenase-like Zn-dependent dehydrogenase
VKALVKVRPEPGLDLLEVAEPTPGPGDVVLRVEASIVCGSDIGRYRWTRNYEAGAAKAMTEDLPRILGHEFAGTVTAVGDRVANARVGQRVAVRSTLGCGTCPECRIGYINVCRTRKTIGVHRDGGYAERVAVPAANASPIPNDMDVHVAAGVGTFAISTHAVRQAGLEPGDRILIWGAGPVGLAVLLAAQLRGIGKATVVDLSRDRLAVAAELGADVVDASKGDIGGRLMEEVGPRSVEAVFEAAGAPEAVAASLPVLRKRRPVVLIGNMRASSDVDLMPLIMDEQRLLGSRSKSLESWDLALATIGSTAFARTLGPDVELSSSLAHFEAAATGTGGPFTIVPDA